MPDDPWFDELDPMLKIYMYQHWIQDYEEKNEFAKSYATFVGSFYNPEMARQIMDSEAPENVTESSEEEFDESTRWVLEDRERYLKEQQSNVPVRRKRRRRRKIITDENDKRE
jgi:hypothetical protein